ncbi:DNA phosphorothioation system sulfurtransferase DndC [Thiocystis violascens]|uniref:Putative sulfurtransferase DndC n=1 Tax=Thiocystis violascens (strain ATCC 17096 / DSM 198 / 6111) TaxID=765911 RepID=I3YBP5_THIV6|nr:DNA phosphorothioation system sulfurtransferase DndC [Thiocystis violascens]AFL74413.1 putative sulfurtransferase DndC [Thiocystis violascens DSM 198]
MTTPSNPIFRPDSEPGHLADTRNLLRNEYAADRRPWVVAYSGGKDSTLVLQLVYDLLLELGSSADKPIFVVASDTRVEAPNVEEYLADRLSRLSSHARANGLPVHVHRVQPTPEQSFWGNLIGKGYPSPTRWFRWCTAKMKIKPSKAVIDGIVREHGGVVLLLGTRLDESASRAQRMEGRATNSRGLNPHGEIPDALVMTPIADWTTDQVWEYLFTHNPPPWGGTHDFMLDLYRQASGGECPVVLDLNTPSCGGSRFGCWTCTVVKEDKSMRGFIESGAAWMRPLNEFRDWLKAIREETSMRDGVRRNDSIGPGPFNSEARKTILRRLLELEKTVGRRLIEDAEIAYIQKQWSDKFDVTDSALAIAREFGREVGALKIKPEDSFSDLALIEELAPRFEVQSIWATDLYHLVTERYPSLDSPRSHQQLLDDVIKVVENAVRQADRTEPAA